MAIDKATSDNLKKALIRAPIHCRQFQLTGKGRTLIRGTLVPLNRHFVNALSLSLYIFHKNFAALFSELYLARWLKPTAMDNHTNSILSIFNQGTYSLSYALIA
jgi:hypothetical protein